MVETNSSWPWECASPIEDWKQRNLRRVDISGIPVMVLGEHARQHLEQINQQLAGMKLALHRIGGGHSEDPQLEAIRALMEDE